MVTLQAMSAGKPVVTTDAGGARYLVEDGKTGFVVPIDDPPALAEALHKTLRDPAELDSMGRRAREVADNRFRATAAKHRH